MSQRTAFLAWFRERYPDEVTLTCREAFDMDDDRFINPKTATAWAAWQAATNRSSASTAPAVDASPSADERFTFGKYKGQLYEDILKANPGYFVWLETGFLGHNVPQSYIDRAKGKDKPPLRSSTRTHADDYADDDIPF